MDLGLNGRRALVTGSSAGIGEAVARRLAAEGAKVVIHGRNRERAEAVAQSIRDSGGEAAVAIGDLASDAEAERVVSEATSAFGGLEIVVNNAGGYDPSDWTTSTEHWHETFNQNVYSMARVIKGTLDEIKKDGHGRFVQLSSGIAQQPWPEMPDYAASKAANANMTVSLSKALAGTGATANSVSPGPVKTPGLEDFFRGMAQQQGWPNDWDSIEKLAVEHVVPNPSGRIGRVEDIADAVAFLASDRASYINGANIRVDGGYVASVN